jgi:uncharacterized protein (DUF1499 family)
MKKKMLKAIFTILVVISLIVLARFYMLGNTSKTGKAPGLVSGRLSACPDKPNCVSSEIADDHSHYISPLRYPASMSEETMDLIKEVLQEVGGEITAEEGAYISATFTSAFFGFVDDVECRNDKANHTIHLRSASRVGHSDFGTNRKRVAFISSLFHKRVNTAKQEMTPTNTRPLSSG